jgi:hypothetical protein
MGRRFSLLCFPRQGADNWPNSFFGSRRGARFPAISSREILVVMEYKRTSVILLLPLHPLSSNDVQM